MVSEFFLELREEKKQTNKKKNHKLYREEKSKGQNQQSNILWLMYTSSPSN